MERFFCGYTTTQEAAHKLPYTIKRMAAFPPPSSHLPVKDLSEFRELVVPLVPGIHVFKNDAGSRAPVRGGFIRS
jgi:hypothetical protein